MYACGSKFRSTASNLIFKLMKKKTQPHNYENMHTGCKEKPLLLCFIATSVFISNPQTSSHHASSIELTQNWIRIIKKKEKEHRSEEQVIKISSWAYQTFCGFASTELHAFDKIKWSQYKLKRSHRSLCYNNFISNIFCFQSQFSCMMTIVSIRGVINFFLPIHNRSQWEMRLPVAAPQYILRPIY